MTPSDSRRPSSRAPDLAVAPHCGVCAQARRTPPITSAITRYLGGSDSVWRCELDRLETGFE
jgi:hypothetical protein